MLLAEQVFAPLGMRDLTFDDDAGSAGKIATFSDTGPKPAFHYRFTAGAAVSLHVTLTDLATFMPAHMLGDATEPALQLDKLLRVIALGAGVILVWGGGPLELRRSRR